MPSATFIPKKSANEPIQDKNNIGELKSAYDGAKDVKLSLAEENKAVKNLSKKLARHFNDETYNKMFIAVPLPKYLHKGKLAFEAVFGKKIIAIKATGKETTAFKGVTVDNDNLFVNIEHITDENFNFFTVASHELLHSIKRNNPKLYKEFAEFAEKHIKKGSIEQYQKFLESLSNGITYDRDYVIEELLAKGTKVLW